MDHEPHSHDCYEIIVNTEGEGTAEIGGQEYPFSPGSVHVIPPEMAHRKTAPGGFRDIYLRTDTLNRTDAPRKKDAENHGYGLKSIYNIVHSYGGKIEVRTEDQIFYLEIMIP